MEWVWILFRPHITKQLEIEGHINPSDEELEQRFITVLSETTVTVLVQVPWQNSVRFKGLARYDSDSMFDLLMNPMDFLYEHFGGGKFKLNFHQGWNFVATQNFKPQGPPRWEHLPEIEF